MRQVWIPRAGPPEVLELREAPDPLPAAGEVRIRVEASGVNFADIMGRLGIYPDLPAMPVVPGYEVAGRIDAVAVFDRPQYSDAFVGRPQDRADQPADGRFSVGSGDGGYLQLTRGRAGQRVA